MILPASLESIGSKAFANCTSLMEIRIPASVSSIANDAFEDSDNILIVTTDGSFAESYANAHTINVMIKIN